jgi:glutamyl-tRNA synthetase
MQYRDEGYLPEALLNYLVRLSWSHGDQEIFFIAEMITLFELEDINVSASSFNPEKLLWLNHHYLMHSDPLHVAHHLRWHLGQLGIDPTDGPDPAEVVKAQRERNKTLVDMAKSSVFLYKDFDAYDEKAAQKNLTPDSALLLQDLYDSLAVLATWDKESIHAAIEQLAQEAQVKMGVVAQPLRVAVSGTTVSPPIDVTLYLLGKSKTLARIERAVSFVKQNSSKKD